MDLTVISDWMAPQGRRANESYARQTFKENKGCRARL